MADATLTAWLAEHALEIGGGAITGASGLYVYLRKQLNERLKPIEQRLDTYKPKEQIAEDKAAMMKHVDDVRHGLRNDITNIAARVHLLEQGRVSDIARMSAMEANLSNLKEGQARLENAIARNHQETLDAINAWATQFSESLREVREVRPRN